MSLRDSRRQAHGYILTINGGSSSLKCSLFQVGPPLTRVLSCTVDRIGFPEGTLTLTNVADGTSERKTIRAAHHKDSIDPLIAWLEQQVRIAGLVAIGHRVVHGGHRYREPQVITSEVLGELRRLSPYDPEHLPAEIELIETFGRRYPTLPQVACFDTAFHRDMPRVARLLPIPRRYEAAGVQRYGFHGLSYAYLMEELRRLAPHEAQGRIILAHLGNGASMAAVRGGRSIDTSMGFTPTAGLPMSTRSGDLDPGLVAYLSRTEGMTVEQFHTMVNQQSGLLGLSETSSDIRDLLACEDSDIRAAEAVACFCYQAKKWIGSFAAALGGLEMLVFSGGIGENSAIIRSRICEGLEFLGMTIDDTRNGAGEAVISTEGSRVTVRVIHTDEEREIAQSVVHMITADTREG
ncbi:MAG: acetate/propionate family kinase [Nitrospirota bacterium]|nr:acetate/propionate family kinase [Nitrospirota bacterium]